MTWMAYGFLLAGTGLFVIPRDAGLGRLPAGAGDRATADPTRALVGLTMIVAGIVGLKLLTPDVH